MGYFTFFFTLSLHNPVCTYPYITSQFGLTTYHVLNIHMCLVVTALDSVNLYGDKLIKLIILGL